MAQTKNQAEAAIAAAATQVVDARECLARWQANLAGARDELGAAEAVSGDELLDDTAKAAAWPVRVREARDAVEVAARAVSAQEPRVRAAEAAWCRAHAVLLAIAEVAPARKALEQHEARTQELLALLEDHDGPYVPQIELTRARRSLGYDGGSTGGLVRVPKSVALQIAVARAKVRHQVLAVMSDGVDPAGVVTARQYPEAVTEDECYPDCVRAGGLVPAPVFVQRAETLRQVIQDLEGLPALLRAEITDLEEQRARGELPADALQAARARREHRISEVPAELAQARSELAALTAVVEAA